MKLGVGGSGVRVGGRGGSWGWGGLDGVVLDVGAWVGYAVFSITVGTADTSTYPRETEACRPLHNTSQNPDCCSTLEDATSVNINAKESFSQGCDLPTANIRGIVNTSSQCITTFFGSCLYYN